MPEHGPSVYGASRFSAAQGEAMRLAYQAITNSPDHRRREIAREHAKREVDYDLQAMSRIENGEVIEVSDRYYASARSQIIGGWVKVAFAVWGMRVVADTFGVQITRRKAYVLLCATHFVLNDVLPDRRGVPRLIKGRVGNWLDAKLTPEPEEPITSA